MSLLESIGTGPEELRKCVQIFLLFLAGTIPEDRLGGSWGWEGNKAREHEGCGT